MMQRFHGLSAFSVFDAQTSSLRYNLYSLIVVGSTGCKHHMNLGIELFLILTLQFVYV